ncbi:arginase family protein [Pseudomonas protegens]|uniref:arginase family protein n=1 Tax=Pseudomonas protegens TaxID=380021 RepID=UPI000F4BE8A8
MELVIIRLPCYTATTHRPGARLVPRGANRLYRNRDIGPKFDPFDELAVVDYGDCEFDLGVPESVPASIGRHADEILKQGGGGLLTLDGDHFINF